MTREEGIATYPAVISTKGRDLLPQTTGFHADARKNTKGSHRDLPRRHLDQRERSQTGRAEISCWEQRDFLFVAK
ncbi:hypothetical protein JT06_01575 [Desulfobulbus sp. Tol-SR]|nr:hypothetical protein JT06_01575 [Desulfobulbus sp. Tol-SR]